MQLEPKTYEVDPDPAQVASVCIAASSFVLTLVNMYLTHGRKPAASRDDNADSMLTKLEDSAQNLLASVQALTKLIDRSSSNPDAQFYDAPMRISKTQMLFSKTALGTYAGQLSSSYTAVGALGLWVNHLIANKPDLAARIGERLSVPLSDVAEQLNSAMEIGLPIRVVVREARLSLEQLAAAIEAELNDGRN
ncbi:hypothetical protein [Brevundimonas sp. LPMIX5]|uniref:hypothetical protein n=1 Tax=Brevundimonas sp. LPMIX5 TaxID=2305887 RepID=UPI0011C39883|nr:hypothetical protein [Brevundimonas sp. LPMIX5]